MGYWSELLQEQEQLREGKVLDQKRAEVEKATRAASTVKGIATGAVVGGLIASGAGKDKIGAGIGAGGLFGAMFGHAAGKDHATSEGLKVARTHQRLRDYLKRDPDADELDIAYAERKDRENKAAWNKAGNALATGAKVAGTAIALKTAYDRNQAFKKAMGMREAEPVEIKQDYMARSTFAESIAEQPMQTNQNVRGWWEQASPEALQESMIDNYIARIRRTHKIAGGALGGIVGGTAGSFAGKTGAVIGAGLGTAAGVLRGNKTSDADVAYVRKAYNKLKADLGREPSESELDHYMEENFGLTEGVSQQPTLSNRSVMNDADANFRRGSEPGPWGRSKSFADYLAEDFRAQNPRAQMHYEPARHAPQQAVIQGRYGVVRESSLDEVKKIIARGKFTKGAIGGGLGYMAGGAIGELAGHAGRAIGKAAGAVAGAGVGYGKGKKDEVQNFRALEKLYADLKSSLRREPTTEELASAYFDQE